MKNLKASREHAMSAAATKRLERGEEVVVVTSVNMRGHGIDKGAYVFGIRGHKRDRWTETAPITWSATVYVTKAKDVLVKGDAPTHIVNCLEASYEDLRITPDNA